MDFHFLFTTYQSTTLSALLYYVPSVYVFYDTVLCKSEYGVLYFVDSSTWCIPARKGVTQVSTFT